MRKIRLRPPMPRGRGAHRAASGRGPDDDPRAEDGGGPATPATPANGGSNPGNGDGNEGGAVAVATAARVARRVRTAATARVLGPRSVHAGALSGLERISNARRTGPPTVAPPSGGPEAAASETAETRPATSRPAAPPTPPGAPSPPFQAAGRVLVIGFICLGLWVLLDSHSLQRSAQSSPLGARRTAALTVLRPIVWVGNGTGLAYVGDLVKDALGRPTGGPVVKSTPPVPVASPQVRHTARPRPAAPVPAGAPRPSPPPLPPVPQPTAANPLRVLAIGDSIGEDFGQSLVAKLGATGVVQATLDGKIDTGLARPDYFDWPGELRTDVSRFQPDLVVAMMGANDNQSFLVGDRAVQFGSPDWVTVYTQRVATMMNEATAQGGRMVWVGMPIMPSGSASGQMQVLNSIVAGQAAVHPGVTYLDSWHLFVDGSGKYSAYLPDASGGQQRVREPDGLHLARPGSDRLADSAIAAIQSQLGVRLGS